MRNFVIINGVNSNTINGLGINELPPITKPEMRNIREEIDGRDGDIITNLGYSAYDKTITIGLFGTGYDINNIVAFFNGEGTIVFSNEPDKYYNFKILNQIDYESLQKFRTASITFHCQPFKYPLSETPLEIEYDYIEDEGETLTLNNTGNSTLKLDLKGNTSQSGTPTPTSPIPVSVVSGDNDVVVCGKNMLSVNQATTITTNGITFNVNSDGSIQISGTATANADITLSDNTYKSNINLANATMFDLDGTYTYSIGNTTNKVSSILRRNDSGYIYYKTMTGDTTFTYSGELLLVIRIPSGTTINETIYPMLEKNSSATSYEPYTSQTYEVDLPVENLLDISDITSGNGITNNGDGSITLQGGVTSNSFSLTTPFVLKANQTYTLSITNTNSNYSASTFILRTGSTNRVVLSYNLSSVNYTPTQDITIDTLRIFNGNNTFDNFTFFPQLEVGSKQNKWQPYGTTPIELCKIGTYQDYFTKNSGKNKFNGTMYNGQIGSNGGFSASTNRITNAEQEISNTFYLEKGTYTLSINGLDYCTALTKDSNNTILQNFANSWNALPFTFTLTQDGYLYFTARRNDNANITPSLYKVMLNEGTTALPYEPYGTNQWCKYNAIGKVVLDGSETPSSVSAGTNTTRASYNHYADGSAGSQVYCNLLTYVSNWGNDVEGVCYDTNNGGFWFRINKSTIGTTSDSVKTYLSSNNLICYLPLAIPYLSLIEDTNLIEQLDNLENAMSYEGQTNISQVNNDKAFIISAKALEDGTNEVVVNNIGNVYSKPLLALEGSGNVDIYLDNTQILRANVEDKMNIDIAQLEAYNPDTMTLLNRQVIGNYNSMTLQPGNNTIRIDGALDKATITNYVRWL